MWIWEKTEEEIEPMGRQTMDEKELEEELKEAKQNKAAGPNGLKAEMFKIIGRGTEGREKLRRGINKALETGKTPEVWKSSTTRMIKKIEKPTVRDFRPIALVDVSCKIFFSLKKRIEEHLIRNNLALDNQIGFTKGGRIEYNHFILQYVIEKTYRSRAKYHDKLIVVALDF